MKATYFACKKCGCTSCRISRTAPDGSIRSPCSKSAAGAKPSYVQWVGMHLNNYFEVVLLLPLGVLRGAYRNLISPVSRRVTATRSHPLEDAVETSAVVRAGTA